MNLQIQQRVALVCGAGSGLGQAIACPPCAAVAGDALLPPPSPV